PDAEKPTLDSWILAHAGDPMYRFGDPSSIDPGSQTEDLGDDGVKASTYGIANLKRILPNLRTWTMAPGANYDQLRELYEQVIIQWARYMGHVTTIVGGVDQTRKADDQSGPVYTVLPKARQQAAMQFLAAQAFATPSWMIDTTILRRIEHAGIVERLRTRQVAVLNNVLDPRRMQRLIEASAVLGNGAYSLPEMLGGLRQAVWSELGSGSTIDPYRRNLQRGYLDRMNYLMTQELDPIPPKFRQYFTGTDVTVSQSDIRPLVRGELVEIQRQIRSDLPRIKDVETRLHLQDALARIDLTLNPRKQ
ncbi:MAG: zinc-dependent metalloprotease, partial [Gemmatimonadales bacterium]